ncbi:MAG: hypothetical protein ACKO0M_07605 [Cyanobium sp.]
MAAPIASELRHLMGALDHCRGDHLEEPRVTAPCCSPVGVHP